MGRHTSEETSSSMRRFSRRAKIISGVFGASLALGTGVAVAAWLVTGSGTGSVSTQTIQNLSIAVDGLGGFYPGSSQQTTARVSNPNGFPVTITSATATSDSPCYTITVDNPGPVGATVVALTRADRYVDNRTTFTLTVTMPDTAGPSCSNVTLTPTVTVNGQVGT